MPPLADLVQAASGEFCGSLRDNLLPANPKKGKGAPWGDLSSQQAPLPFPSMQMGYPGTKAPFHPAKNEKTPLKDFSSKDAFAFLHSILHLRAAFVNHFFEEEFCNILFYIIQKFAALS